MSVVRASLTADLGELGTVTIGIRVAGKSPYLRGLMTVLKQDALAYTNSRFVEAFGNTSARDDSVLTTATRHSQFALRLPKGKGQATCRIVVAAALNRGGTIKMVGDSITDCILTPLRLDHGCASRRAERSAHKQTQVQRQPTGCA